MFKSLSINGVANFNDTDTFLSNNYSLCTRESDPRSYKVT